MWDYTGHNITRDQVAPIDGTIPTVTIGTVATAPQSAGSSPRSRPGTISRHIGDSSKHGLRHRWSSSIPTPVHVHRPVVQLLRPSHGPAAALHCGWQAAAGGHPRFQCWITRTKAVAQLLQKASWVCRPPRWLKPGATR